MAVAAALAVLQAARLVLVHGIALVLVLAGYRPAPAAPVSPLICWLNCEPVPHWQPAAMAAPVAPVALDWAGRPLDCLTVAELRLQARAAGHRGLARNGRRADLLAVLAAA